MKKRRGTYLAIIAALALSMPAMASADIDFDGNANFVCLVTDSGNNYYCAKDGDGNFGNGIALTSWTLNLLGGNDTLVVSSGDCDCDCNDKWGSFAYGGNTLTVNGGTGDDVLYGGDGRNAFGGDGGSDRVRTGDHNSDSLSGSAGLDWFIDTSGTSETMSSGADNDTIRDIGCSYTSIDCGTGADKCGCGAGPTTYCGSATCENTAPAISISCPI